MKEDIFSVIEVIESEVARLWIGYTASEKDWGIVILRDLDYSRSPSKIEIIKGYWSR